MEQLHFCGIRDQTSGFPALHRACNALKVIPTTKYRQSYLLSMAWQGGAEKGRLVTPTFDSSSNSVIERNKTYIERLTKPKTLDL